MIDQITKQLVRIFLKQANVLRIKTFQSLKCRIFYFITPLIIVQTLGFLNKCIGILENHFIHKARAQRKMLLIGPESPDYEPCMIEKKRALSPPANKSLNPRGGQASNFGVYHKELHHKKTLKKIYGCF